MYTEFCNNRGQCRLRSLGKALGLAHKSCPFVSDLPSPRHLSQPVHVLSVGLLVLDVRLLSRYLSWQYIPGEPTQGYSVLPDKGGAWEAFPARGIDRQLANPSQSCGLMVGAAATMILDVAMIMAGLSFLQSDRLLNDSEMLRGLCTSVAPGASGYRRALICFICSNLTQVSSAQKIRND